MLESDRRSKRDKQWTPIHSTAIRYAGNGGLYAVHSTLLTHHPNPDIPQSPGDKTIHLRISKPALPLVPVDHGLLLGGQAGATTECAHSRSYILGRKTHRKRRYCRYCHGSMRYTLRLSLACPCPARVFALFVLSKTPAQSPTIP